MSAEALTRIHRMLSYQKDLKFPDIDSCKRKHIII